jgi:hypothetical protein
MKRKHHLDDLNVDGKGASRWILKKEYDFSGWMHLAPVAYGSGCIVLLSSYPT